MANKENGIKRALCKNESVFARICEKERKEAMIEFYKTINNKISRIDSLEDGCWINVVSPSEEEIGYLIEDLQLDSGFVRSSLDEEETSRIESEDDQVLLIIDAPRATTEAQNTILYTTMPFGIIIKDTFLVTICLSECSVLKEVADGMVRNIQTHLKNRFIFSVLLRIATRYLQYLKQIDKITNMMEEQLQRSMRNKELFQLLGLEKSLVYFSTSLKSNEVTLEKLLRGRVIKLYEEDQDLLEDVLIEFKQAIEMANIYSSILSGMMDAFSSIISNNLNIVMKVLAAVTILMSIPTIIASFYGMNVTGIPLPDFWFPVVISGVVVLVAAIILIKMKMFSK